MQMNELMIEKRNGDIVPFDAEKIKTAVNKAQQRTKHNDDIGDSVVDYVVSRAETPTLHVNLVHKLVENGLMDIKAFDTAREYTVYRAKHMPDIFRPRTEYKPFQYPHLADFTGAIQNSYWLVSEFSFTGDIQDFKQEFTDKEREVVRRCMLSISQIEVSVKKFWSRIGDKFPIPEIEEVGSTFGESEVRHSRAYSHLLEILGLNSEFAKVLEVPAIQKRVEYMRKAMEGAKTNSNKEFIENILLFSLFVENVSLFSQFLTISQISKQNGSIKGISTVIAATSLEEIIHGMFGSELINTIRSENPEWFDSDLTEKLHSLALEAFEAEKEIVGWIFESGDLPYLTKEEVVEYIKNRFNQGFLQSGFPTLFDVDDKKLENVQWFDIQNESTVHTDFLAKRSVNYTKFTRAFDENELF